jgi:hypothetical protein
MVFLNPLSDVVCWSVLYYGFLLHLSHKMLSHWKHLHFKYISEKLDELKGAEARYCKDLTLCQSYHTAPNIVFIRSYESYSIGFLYVSANSLLCSASSSSTNANPFSPFIHLRPSSLCSACKYWLKCVSSWVNTD